MAVVLFIQVTGLSAQVAKDHYKPTDTSTEWFEEARFGMFVHWGIYSMYGAYYEGKHVPGIAEWIMKRGNIPIDVYEAQAEKFDPVKFEAELWAKAARDAGMKYLLITTKHHDGFCLWDSKVSDYDVIDHAAYGKDIIKALHLAAEKYGIKLALYYSILDWHHPDVSYHFRKGKTDVDFDRYIEEYMKPQLAELLSGQYGEVGMLWFDGGWENWWTFDRGRNIYNFVKSISPNTIVNDRLDKDHSKLGGSEIGDYITPEQNIPAMPTSTLKPGDVWETVLTMNNSWGYSKADHNWKSPRELIRSLIEVASRGGNLTLNVGPKPDGTFTSETTDILNAIGKWMKVNGEAIHGTTHSELGVMPWGRLTVKDDTKYLHVFEWPRDELNIRLDHWNPRKIKRIYALANPNKSLDFKRTGVEVRIKVPQPMPDPIASVIAIEFGPDPKAKPTSNQNLDQ